MQMKALNAAGRMKWVKERENNNFKLVLCIMNDNCKIN